MRDVFTAIRLNDTSKYYELILSNNINVLNDNKRNLLHVAIAFKNIEICRDLIERGIDVNHKDYNGQTPLHFCAQYRNVEIAKVVLSINGDPNIKDSYGNNALWTATFNARGNYELITLLIEKGGDALSKNLSNRSPLDFAKQINDLELIKILEC